MPLHGPPDFCSTWGIYENSGYLCEDAAYIRGPGRNLIGQSDYLKPRSAISNRLSEPVFYGGMTHDHFGHFLLSVLPRFWSDLKGIFPSARLLMHSTTPLAQWCAKPFVATLLKAAGVNVGDMFTLEEPTVISCLIVSGPGLIEQSRIHTIMNSVGREIGMRLISKSVKISDQPLFLSKERVTSGIWTCVNENELSDSLRSKGARIFHPHEHSLEEQITTIESHRNIISLQSSSLHTTLLCSEPKRIVALGSDPRIVSNFHLVDACKGSTSCYVYPDEGMSDTSPTQGFAISRKLLNPQQCALELLNYL